MNGQAMPAVMKRRFECDARNDSLELLASTFWGQKKLLVGDYCGGLGRNLSEMLLERLRRRDFHRAEP